MSVARGTEVYNVDAYPVTARGIALKQDELETALTGRVSEIIYDDNKEAREMLLRCAKTGFGADRVNEILSSPRAKLEEWRVGEAIAEAYLEAHCQCEFPWPGSRDLKNSRASPGGTDLVGFREHGGYYRFAFGEVKTSSDVSSPPSVVTGRHGLHRQVEALRDDQCIRDELVAYLAHRATRADWRDKYESAATRYLEDSTDVSLFGVLIRDVPPNCLDLRARAVALAEGCPPKTSIDLKAIYLPRGAISTLSMAV